VKQGDVGGGGDPAGNDVADELDEDRMIAGHGLPSQYFKAERGFSAWCCPDRLRPLAAMRHRPDRLASEHEDLMKSRASIRP
jgi:hypothetical protein